MPAPRKKRTPAPKKKVVLGPPNPELTVEEPILTPYSTVEPTPEVERPSLNEEERQAKLSAYVACQNAGIPIPAELKIVDQWIAAEQERRELEAAERAKYQADLDEENAKGPWFVRNGYTAPFSLRLDRQVEKRRIELKARGVPGDMHPLLEEDLKDPVLKRNVQIGVCEIIPAGEANRILEHQTTNPGRRVHTPTAILRRADGKPYEGNPVKTEIEYGAQGITVGVVNPDQMQGGVEDKSVARDGGVQRINPVQPGQPIPSGQREVASQFVPTGGNPYIIQNGPPMSDNVQAKIADDLARRKGVQGPQAGLSGMRVTVDPVQKA